MSSDANRDTASPSSSNYTEADTSDRARKGDLATGPRGWHFLCTVQYIVDFVMATCADHGADWKSKKLFRGVFDSDLLWNYM